MSVVSGQWSVRTAHSAQRTAHGATRLVLAVVLAAAPARANVTATTTMTVAVDEERLFVSEAIGLTVAGAETATLPEGSRRLELPPGSGDGAQVEIWSPPGAPSMTLKAQDGAVRLPATVISGMTIGLRYSIEAAGETASWSTRYPVQLVGAVAIVTGQVGGFRVSIAGGQRSPPAAPGREGSSAMAKRNAPIEPGAALRVTVDGLRACRPPMYARAALVLCAAFVLAGIAAAFSRRRRVKS